MNKILFITISLLLSACSSINESYYYNELVVLNHTNELIRNVSVIASDSNRIFKCSNIAPRAFCSDSFKKRKYLQRPLSISWTFKNVTNKKENIILLVPHNIEKSSPLRGVLSIQLDGSVKVWLEPSKASKRETFLPH